MKRKRKHKLDPNTLRWVAGWISRMSKHWGGMTDVYALELLALAKREELEQAWKPPTEKDIARFEKIRQRALKLTKRAKIAEAKS